MRRSLFFPLIAAAMLLWSGPRASAQSSALTEWNSFPDVIDRVLNDGQFFRVITRGAPLAGELFLVDVNIDSTDPIRGYGLYFGPSNDEDFGVELLTTGDLGTFSYFATGAETDVEFGVVNTFDESPDTTQFDLTNFEALEVDPSLFEALGALGGLTDEEVSVLNLNVVIDSATSGYAVTMATSQAVLRTFEGLIDGIRIRQINNRSGTLNFGSAGGTAFHTLDLPVDATCGIPPVLEMPGTNWRVFTQGAGSLQDQYQIGSHPGYESNTWAGSLGAEYLVGPHLLFGTALTLGENSMDVTGGSGGADLNGTILTAYISALRDGWFLDGRFSSGWIDAEIARQTAFGLTAGASPSSVHHNLAFTAGRQFAAGKWITGPMIGAEYLTMGMDGYREQGAGIFNLVVGDQNQASLESNVGWLLARPFLVANVPVVARFQTAWHHEFFDQARETEFTFDTSPTSVYQGGQFLRQGANMSGLYRIGAPGSDFISAGAGLTANVGWLRASVDYEGELLREDLLEHYFAIQLGTEF